jgi:hypothetical protein
VLPLLRSGVIASTVVGLAAAAAASATVAPFEGSSRSASQSAPPSRITIVDTATAHEPNGYTGTFTASGLVCPSGTWSETEAPVGINTEHVCADGTGGFDSDLRTGRVHLWRFNGGTGPYLSLRGAGDCAVHDPGNGMIVRTCQFFAAFDDVAPSVKITRFSVSAGRGSTVKVRLSFVARDDVLENAVRFRLRIRAGSRTLATRRGSATGELRSFAATGKPPKAARNLTVALTLVDPLANTRAVSRTKRLPG